MAENKLQKVRVQADKLSELIDNERYEDAGSVMDELDAAIRTLTRDDLVSLSEQQQAYLYGLANWLTDNNGDMASRSQQLINTIAPLNANSPLKANKKYQVKSSNG